MSWRKVIILYLFLLTLIVCKKEEDTNLLSLFFSKVKRPGLKNETEKYKSLHIQ